MSTKENCKIGTRQSFTVYYFNVFWYWINKGNLCFSLFHSTLSFTGSNLTSFCHVTHTPCCLHLYFLLLLQYPVFTHSFLISPNFWFALHQFLISQSPSVTSCLRLFFYSVPLWFPFVPVLLYFFINTSDPNDTFLIIGLLKIKHTKQVFKSWIHIDERT